MIACCCFFKANPSHLTSFLALSYLKRLQNGFMLSLATLGSGFARLQICLIVSYLHVADFLDYILSMNYSRLVTNAFQI